MSGLWEGIVKQWTAKRKSALVIEIIQGKAIVAEASRSFDLAPSEIEVGSMTPSRAWRTRCGRPRVLSEQMKGVRARYSSGRNWRLNKKVGSEPGRLLQSAVHPGLSACSPVPSP